MPTWATSAGGRSGSPGSAWCCRRWPIHYMGQGALLMREPAALENPFFRMFSEGLADPGGAARLLRCGDRLAGGDLRRLLDHAPGDPARLPAAHAHRLHLGQRVRPDLHAGGEPGAAGGGAAGDAWPSAARPRWPRPTASPSPRTMFITTLLTFFVVRHGWGYPLPVALAATGVFLALDALLVVAVRAQVRRRRLVPAGPRRGASSC